VAKTGRLVTVHEAPVPFGAGAEIAALAAESCLDYLEAPVRRIGGAFTPVPYSPVLEDAYLPTAATLEAAIREVAS
jgi:pyruvate dehydrogenase E1 component beta subunit